MGREREVVFCAQCRHRGWVQEPCHGRSVDYCKLHEIVVRKTDFCSYGQYRDEEEKPCTVVESELKPCPFCGGEAELYATRHVPHGMDYIPRCKDTSCCGRLSKKYSSKEKATAFWNRRST